MHIEMVNLSFEFPAICFYQMLHSFHLLSTVQFIA